jgi:hypothetical protein
MVAGHPAVMARCTIDGQTCPMIDIEAMHSVPIISSELAVFARALLAIVPLSRIGQFPNPLRAK